MKALLPLLLCVASGCAPLVVVTREQRPALLFDVDQQPVQVKAQGTGGLLLDVLSLFSDSHRRVVHAARAVGERLQQAGVAVTDDAGRSLLEVSVREDAVTVEGGVRTAKVRLWLEAGGVTLTTLDGTAQGDDDDGRLYTAAIENAAAQVVDALHPTEQEDTFRVLRGEGLEDANEKLLDGELAGAIAAYQARLEEKPDDVAAWLNLSTAMTAAGDLAGAALAARRAAEVDTSSRKYDRQQHAEAAAARAQVTTRVLSFTTYGAPKKKRE